MDNFTKCVIIYYIYLQPFLKHGSFCAGKVLYLWPKNFTPYSLRWLKLHKKLPNYICYTFITRNVLTEQLVLFFSQWCDMNTYFDEKFVIGRSNLCYLKENVVMLIFCYWCYSTYIQQASVWMVFILLPIKFA